jgi:spore germination protein GerM
MKKISLILVAILLVWLFVRFVIGGPEDDWICVNNEWVKHGNPSAPKPTTPCGETIKVKIYFNNSKMDPEYSCNKVFPTERQIIKTSAVARAALEELLKGPTDKEKAEGFINNINSGVIIQKLVIENNVAKVDFDEQLEYQVGGSCRVAAIRAQITQTLKQFSSVKNVIISINGRTEDILQP